MPPVWAVGSSYNRQIACRHLHRSVTVHSRKHVDTPVATEPEPPPSPPSPLVPPTPPAAPTPRTPPAQQEQSPSTQTPRQKKKERRRSGASQASPQPPPPPLPPPAEPQPGPSRAATTELQVPVANNSPARRIVMPLEESPIFASIKDYSEIDVVKLLHCMAELEEIQQSLIMCDLIVNMGRKHYRRVIRYNDLCIRTQSWTRLF